MKKFFALTMIFCMSLLTGVFLTACTEQSAYSIEILNSDSANLVDVTLKVGNQIVLENSPGFYNIESASNIRVELIAKKHGIDMKDISVKIGKIDKQVVVNPSYSPLTSGNSLNYGYFLISNLNANMKISISGAHIISSTFTFETKNIGNAAVIEKLKMTSICLDYDDLTENGTGESVEPQYINFYNYLTSPELPNFVRQYDSNVGLYNTYKTFRLKFDGINPFNLLYEFPFYIKTEKDSLEKFSTLTRVDDHYIVDLGDLGLSSEYTIVVDFSVLSFQKFLFAFPEVNNTFEIKIDKGTLDYSQDATATVTKFCGPEIVDYSQMKIFINSLELQMIAGSEIGNTVQFKIPKNLTPLTTGGHSIFTFSVNGIEYLVPFYNLQAYLIEPTVSTTSFFTPNIWTIDDNGEKLGVAGIDQQGQQISLEGQRNAVVWEYNYDKDASAYRSAFNLYDYDIYVNSEQKIMNVKDELADSAEDIVKTLDRGYKFKAFYNEETGVFDNFQLEFVCQQEMIFTFKNFVWFSKNIEVGYSFEDARIEMIEYAVFSQASQSQITWVELDLNVFVTTSVTSDMVVAFRISSSRDLIGFHEFKIENQTISNSSLTGESHSSENIKYTILKFVVSDVVYDGCMQFNLVPAGTR